MFSFRRLAIFIIAVLVIICGLLLAADIAVDNNAEGRTFDNVDNIPHNKYAMLLATSPITPAGEHNYSFDKRIDAAEQLFNSGKCDYIIASGGNYSDTQIFGCDEPKAIRDSLIARGIPDDRIISDYQGTRTINSIANLKYIFKIDSVTLISQKYHNQRAIYLADRQEIAAIAFNADDTPKPLKHLKNTIREYFARLKMFIDLLFEN